MSGLTSSPKAAPAVHNVPIPSDYNEEADRNNQIALAAAKGAGLALVTGGLLALTGAKYSRGFANLTKPMKYFLLGTGTVASSVVFADNARVQFEDRQLLRHLDQEAHDHVRAQIRSQRGVLAEGMYYIRENRNSVVAVSWLTCMAGSLSYTFAKKGLTTTQRIVTARMYAQAFTVAMMMGIAALSLTDEEGTVSKKNEVMTDQWKAILAKDNQGQYIIRDNGTSANSAAVAVANGGQQPPATVKVSMPSA